MVIVISNLALYNIEQFYSNVAKKYKHTYDYSLMYTNIDEAIESMYQIENGLLRREPTITKWKGKGFMANTDKWYFLYTIEGDTVYILDACHSQNMHEALERRVKKLTREYLENRRTLNESAGNTITMNESEMREMISSITRKVIKEEYKPIGKHKFKIEGHDYELESTVTLQSDSSGQVCHILHDDNCYVLWSGDSLDDECRLVNWIFPEAVKALQELPLP